MAEYTIAMVESKPFAQNAYLIWRRESQTALVIDPGFDTDSLLEALQTRGLTIAAILNTHGHVDHIAGNAAMKRAFPTAPIVIGENEATLLTDASANLSAPHGLPIVSPPADRLVVDGERVEYAGLRFLVREIPGHSPGSVVFICDEFAPHFVFGGDVLFAGSIGRTDLGGNLEQLLSGIRAKLFPLADDTIVYSGHGRSTTVGHEKRTNPFVGERAGR